MPTDISRATIPELLKIVNDVPTKDRVPHLREIANLKPELYTIETFNLICLKEHHLTSNLTFQTIGVIIDYIKT